MEHEGKMTESEFEKWLADQLGNCWNKEQCDIWRKGACMARDWILEKAKEYSERVNDPFVCMKIEELLK